MPTLDELVTSLRSFTGRLRYEMLAADLGTEAAIFKAFSKHATPDKLAKPQRVEPHIFGMLHRRALAFSPGKIAIGSLHCHAGRRGFHLCWVRLKLPHREGETT